VGSLQQNEETTSAARSRIVDADFAGETAALASAKVIRQAGLAMLAQLNVGPRAVLALLNGIGEMATN
jgi:flagellin